MCANALGIRRKASTRLKFEVSSNRDSQNRGAAARSERKGLGRREMRRAVAILLRAAWCNTDGGERRKDP